MKQLGHCTACKKAVFEIRETHDGTGDVRVDGTVKSVGAPTPEARITTWVLMNGSTMDLTFCQGCVRNDRADRVVTIWKRICDQEALMLDDDYRRARGGRPIEAKSREARLRLFDLFLTNRPLGMIACRPYEEVLRERR